MPSQDDPGPLHPQATTRSGFRYFFYTKHHRPQNTADAQWSEALSRDEEFSIFDRADEAEVVAANGDHFGLWITATGQILPLGTEQQEIAEFPATRPPHAWHGYPLWPLRRVGDNRRDRLPVPLEALILMEARGWITSAQRRRLSGGKHIS